MKNLHFLLVIISMLFISSCSKIGNEYFEKKDNPSLASKIALSADEWMSIAYDNPQEMSEGDIKTILETFINQEYVIPKKQTRAASSLSSMKEKSRYHLTEKLDQAKLLSGNNSIYDIECTISEYEFELDGVNYRAVISNDVRYPKIIAFFMVKGPECKDSQIMESNLIEDNSSSIINLSYEALYNYLFEIEVVKEALRAKTLQKISKELNKPIETLSIDNIKDKIVINGSNNTSTRAYPIDMPSDQVISGCWPLIEVSWAPNQFKLGDYMPYYWETIRAPVQTGFIAAMHLLSVFRPNIVIPAKNYEGHGYKSSLNVDWDLLTETETFESTDSEQKLQTGARLVRLFSDDGNISYKGFSENSWAMPNYNFPTFYKILQKYIACNNVTNYNLNTIINSLGRAHPVFMDTIDIWGEFIVVDGYLKTRSTSGVNSTYLHLKFDDGNFKWKYTKTGYYLVNADSSLDIEYNSDCISYSKDFKIMAECRPK